MALAFSFSFLRVPITGSIYNIIDHKTAIVEDGKASLTTFSFGSLLSIGVVFRAMISFLSQSVHSTGMTSVGLVSWLGQWHR